MTLEGLSVLNPDSPQGRMRGGGSLPAVLLAVMDIKALLLIRDIDGTLQHSVQINSNNFACWGVLKCPINTIWT